MNAKETLETYIDEGKDWECKQISIRGGSILWMPRTARQLPTLAVEINPIDEQGSQMKMKGIMIRNQRELKALRRVISDSGVVNLVEALASVVPRFPRSERSRQPASSRSREHKKAPIWDDRADSCERKSRGTGPGSPDYGHLKENRP